MNETTTKTTQRFREGGRRYTERKSGQRVLGVSGSEQEMVAAANRHRDAAFGHIDPAIQHRRSAFYLYAVLKYDHRRSPRIEPRNMKLSAQTHWTERLVGRHLDLPWLATAAAALATSSGSPR